METINFVVARANKNLFLVGLGSVVYIHTVFLEEVVPFTVQEAVEEYNEWVLFATEDFHPGYGMK